MRGGIPVQHYPARGLADDPPVTHYDGAITLVAVVERLAPELKRPPDESLVVAWRRLVDIGQVASGRPGPGDR
jgi:hypothetical protein